MSALETALRAELPAEAFGAVMPNRAVDGLMPELVLVMRKPAEVAAALRTAAANGAAVIPWGGGSQMALGMAPQRYDVALDLTGLNQLVEYEPADLTVTVEAGMPLARLQKALSEKGQWLPLDPPLPAAATVGGILATNASGPARIAHGTARDLLIGISVATVDGELVKSGGRVVKNVAGYDMGKLHIGALGTLGVIVQATFKVAPLPVMSVIAGFEGSLEDLLATSALAANRGLPVKGAVLTGGPDARSWSLLLRLAAGTAAVERSRAELKTAPANHLPDEAAQQAWEAWGSGLQANVVLKAAVEPASLAAMCRSLAEAAGRVVAFPGAGIVYGSWDGAHSLGASVIARLRAQAVTAGRGSLVLERAPLDLKREAGVWGEPRGDFVLMKRIKQQFDPGSVLNPGRFLGGI